MWKTLSRCYTMNHRLENIINLEFHLKVKRDIPVQVKLSCGETNVPPGHFVTH